MGLMPTVRQLSVLRAGIALSASDVCTLHFRKVKFAILLHDGAEADGI